MLQSAQAFHILTYISYQECEGNSDKLSEECGQRFQATFPSVISFTLSIFNILFAVIIRYYFSRLICLAGPTGPRHISEAAESRVITLPGVTRRSNWSESLMRVVGWQEPRDVSRAAAAVWSLRSSTPVSATVSADARCRV